MVDLRINDPMKISDVAQTLSVNPLNLTLDGIESVASIQKAVQPVLDAPENILINSPELGNTNTPRREVLHMFQDTFKYDGKNAIVINKEERLNDKGETVVRLTLDNGVVFVYTETAGGFEHLDTNFVLTNQPNGYYYSDLSEPKKDFKDYY